MPKPQNRIGIGFLLFLIATIFLITAITKPVNACTASENLSSSTITQGTSSITVSGHSDCDNAGDTVNVTVYGPGGTCPSSGTPSGPVALSGLSTTLTGTLTYSLTVTTSTLTPGSYCVHAQGPTQIFLGIPFLNVNDPLTVTVVIPEYPLGLPLLALFMIFGYAVMRRKNSAYSN